MALNRIDFNVDDPDVLEPIDVEIRIICVICRSRFERDPCPHQCPWSKQAHQHVHCPNHPHPFVITTSNPNDPQA